MDYNLQKKALEILYAGEGRETEVNFEGEKIKGIMFGNDSCFEGDNFYQWLLTKEKLLYCFYNIEDENGNQIELDNIDYSKPVNIVEYDINNI